MRKILLFVYILLLTTSPLAAEMKLRPVPWITEGAIGFLDEFFETHENPKVLEFGCGASTHWLAKRTDQLTSIEHTHWWVRKLKSVLRRDPAANAADLRQVNRPYYWICDEFEDESFDLILVDGRNRKGCIAHFISKLKPGGVLMLDNSEREQYFAVFPLMDGWECDSFVQVEPDSCNFIYPGWETRWWIKPLS